MEIKVDAKTGLRYREGTLDEFVIREQNTYQKLFDYINGKVVLDIGGNIGAFAHRAIQEGAKKVYSFEPEPENIKMFKSQKLDNVKLLEYAVAKSDGTARLYVNGKANKGLHTLRKVRGREFVEVKTIAFEKIFKKIKPYALKIDIEGGEYEIDFKHIPDCVKVIAVELHLTPVQNKQKGKELLKYLRSNFKELSNSKIGNNWTTLFIGIRK